MRLGEPGMGWKLLMKKLEFERFLVVASSLGLAQAAVNDAGAYASERICFNKPIAHQTQIQLHLCEMENIIQNVRTRLYQVVTMIDNGESTRLESALLQGLCLPRAHPRCRPRNGNLRSYRLHQGNPRWPHLGRPPR